MGATVKESGARGLLFLYAFSCDILYDDFSLIFDLVGDSVSVSFVVRVFFL